MRFTSLTIMAAAALLIAASPGDGAGAQPGAERSVDQYTCKDIMREDGAAREVAIGFLHGYLVGKSGSPKFNLADLQKQTDGFIDHCLDNPKDKAEQAMMKQKGK
jgi:hypothetical protein